MRILDALFGKEAYADDRMRNQPMPVPHSRLSDKEIISIDPNEVSRDSSSRPPVVFENGLQ